MTTIASEIERLQTAKADLKSSIENKGVTVDSTATLDTYDDYVDSISGGGEPEVEEKDVNFYDWDGTRLYSYTKEEFLELEAFPEFTSKDSRLISEEWNWTFENAHNYARDYGKVDIGAIYNTLDDNTYIDVDVYDKLNLSVFVYIKAFKYSGVTWHIDWGDNHIDDLVFQSSTQAQKFKHTYESLGKYTITIYKTGTPPYFDQATFTPVAARFTSEGGIAFICGSNPGGSTVNSYATHILFGGNASLDPTTYYYFNGLKSLKGVVLSKNLSLGSPSKQSSPFLGMLVEHINIPRSITCMTSIGGPYRQLKRCILPDSITEISTLAIYGDHLIVPPLVTKITTSFTLKSHKASFVLLPDGLTSLGSETICNDSTLSHLNIPPTVTNIAGYVFNISQNSPFKQLDFRRHSSVPSILSTTFGTIGESIELEILVKDSMYDQFTTTTNWSEASLLPHIIPFDGDTRLTPIVTNLIVDPNITGTTTINKPKIYSLEGHTRTLPTLSDITTDKVGGSWYFSDGTSIFDLGDSITIVPNKEYTLYYAELYIPTTEELESLNGILGEDSSDPATPDLTDVEVNEVLDEIIGGNE